MLFNRHFLSKVYRPISHSTVSACGSCFQALRFLPSSVPQALFHQLPLRPPCSFLSYSSCGSASSVASLPWECSDGSGTHFCLRKECGLSLVSWQYSIAKHLSVSSASFRHSVPRLMKPQTKLSLSPLKVWTSKVCPGSL